MDSLLENLEATFLSWGLSENQEQNLISMVKTGVDNSLVHYEKGLSVDQELHNIVESMSGYTKQYL